LFALRVVSQQNHLRLLTVCDRTSPLVLQALQYLRDLNCSHVNRFIHTVNDKK
jgi:hypothetical protein